jgi:hypothetical protein
MMNSSPNIFQNPALSSTLSKAYRNSPTPAAIVKVRLIMFQTEGKPS